MLELFWYLPLTEVSDILVFAIHVMLAWLLLFAATSLVPVLWCRAWRPGPRLRRCGLGLALLLAWGYDAASGTARWQEEDSPAACTLNLAYTPLQSRELLRDLAATRFGLGEGMAARRLSERETRALCVDYINTCAHDWRRSLFVPVDKITPGTMAPLPQQLAQALRAFCTDMQDCYLPELDRADSDALGDFTRSQIAASMHRRYDRAVRSLGGHLCLWGCCLLIGWPCLVSYLSYCHIGKVQPFKSPYLEKGPPLGSDRRKGA